MDVASQANFTLASPITYVTSKRTVFGVDIKPVRTHMASQTTCRPTFFVTELNYLKIAAEEPI